MCGCNKNKGLKAAPKDLNIPQQKSLNLPNQVKLTREELLQKLRSRMSLVKATS